MKRESANKVIKRWLLNKLDTEKHRPNQLTVFNMYSVKVGKRKIPVTVRILASGAFFVEWKTKSEKLKSVYADGSHLPSAELE